LAKSRGCGDTDSHAFEDKVWALKIMAQAKCVAKNRNIEKQKLEESVNRISGEKMQPCISLHQSQN
jgi:hypothetical protein